MHLGVADGRDVRQLEQNLVALGYDPNRDIEIDDHFESATAAAIKRWEKARGVRADGVVELGEIVFLPGARRIGEHRASLGTVMQPGAEVMETSSTRQVVTVKLDATRQGLVGEGDRVSVELPDGRSVNGRVTEVGRVAQTDAQTDGSDADGEEEDSYVLVTVTLDSRVRAFDQAPVDVDVAKETKRDALAVPVEALLALAGGGYAVEVVEGGLRRLIAVELGVFADGYVEISGNGIREGMRVAVPR